VRRAGLVAALGCAAALFQATPARAQIYTRVRNGVVEATNIPDESDFRLTYPGKGTLIHSRGFHGSYHGEYDRHIQDAAATNNVPVDLVRAVIQVESEYDRYAVSSKGARGLMQLMPFTAQRFGVLDAFDPRQNIFAGTQYLRLLLDLFQNDVALALAAYNAGENAVQRFGGIPPYKETQAYVQKVQALLGRLPAISFAPRRAASERHARPAPAPPAVYYRFHDDRGVLHVSQEPPADGVPYSLIRALDR
jgi:soluble lytic murein transglycosylase-like protein